MKKQSGFTLIELVMVIVILGILSAFALPRFADFSGDAKKATRGGIDGALRSATAIAHASCLTNSACNQAGATATVTIDGQSINLVYGYPAGAAGGIDKAADVQNVGSAFASGVATFTINGDAACTVTYTQAANATTPPVFGGVATCN